MSAAPMFTLAQAAAWLPGTQVQGEASTPILRVHTDTRTLQAGDLYVALRGERFDGHDYLAQAFEAGAAATLGERAPADRPALIVPDSLAALHQLAQAWRAQDALRSVPVIAVTGSNGKTTVTQMIASILQAWRGEASLATRGNLNNHIGVPLSVLRLRPSQHQVAVLELGMNHPGEIAELAAIAQATVAVVNNAQREHQEFMKTVQAVAEENGAVLTALPPQGVAVYPVADDYAPVWDALAGTRPRMRFALQGDAHAEQAEVLAKAEWADDAWHLAINSPQGQVQARLGLAGRHNARNAVAAAAAALAAGAPLAAVAQGLGQFQAVTGRSHATRIEWQGQTALLIDDSYNANPDSVRAAIDVLAELPAPRWLVLGDMGEVGQDGPQYHREVGEYARARGIDIVWTAGTLAAHTAQACGAAVHGADAAGLIAQLGEALAAGTAPQAASILVKGSRFMKMEQVVRALHPGKGSPC